VDDVAKDGCTVQGKVPDRTAPHSACTGNKELTVKQTTKLTPLPVMLNTVTDG
jgi:hypothetical protein